ncbi:MAG TPA: hypothetical protein VN610_03540, partial [Bryobacteraceae bacterium]|nr:hypothetical protein [Bryobacteraceae bacterium]
MNDLLVMKFGGTSMGSAERIRVAAQICAEQRALRPVVAVVSAMSKITDLLLDALRKAEAGDETGLDLNLQQLRERHWECCAQLLDGERREAALAGIEALISDFRRITHGIRMLGERPPRSVDEAISIGERLSALTIAAYLNASGTRAKDVNAAQIVVTDSVFGNASPLMDETRKRAESILRPMLRDGVLPVI